MIDRLDRFAEFDDPVDCQLLYIEHSHQRRDVGLIEYCWKYRLCDCMMYDCMMYLTI